MRFLFSFCVPFLLLVVSCAQQRETQTVTESIPSLSLKLKEDEARRTIQVEVDWSHLAENTVTTLHRQKEKDVKSNEDLSSQLDQDVTRFVDSNVVPGQTYQYFVGTLEGPQYRLLAMGTIHVPLDVYIDGETTSLPKGKIRKLVFGKNGVLLTQGNDLKIAVEEVISDEGKILTFHPQATAPQGADGRAGGTIDITAKRATGKLTIHGEGENGGPGAPGIDGKPGVAGAAGTAGESRLKNFNNQDLFHKVFSQLAEQALQKGDMEGVRKLVECTRQPTSGGNGTDGVDGTNGGNGGRGGDSAQVKVRIADKTQLVLDVVVDAGIPGMGGKGGAPGVGGAGGAAGALDHFRVCTPAAGGAPGRDGRAGTSGRFGARGNRFEPDFN